MSAARPRAEDSLQRTHQELEARVHERAADLERSNEQGHVWILESLDRSSRSMRAGEAIKLVHSQSTETCRPPPAS